MRAKLRLKRCRSNAADLHPCRAVAKCRPDPITPRYRVPFLAAPRVEEHRRPGALERRKCSAPLHESTDWTHRMYVEAAGVGVMRAVLEMRLRGTILAAATTLQLYDGIRGGVDAWRRTVHRSFSTMRTSSA